MIVDAGCSQLETQRKGFFFFQFLQTEKEIGKDRSQRSAYATCVCHVTSCVLQLTLSLHAKKKECISQVKSQNALLNSTMPFISLEGFNLAIQFPINWTSKQIV